MTGRSRQPARTSAAAPVRKSGRHPAAEHTVVRLTEAAVGDLQRMVAKGDPQVVKWALKKCLLLERDPEAGEQLRGGLIGYRKLVVGDRDWRIVWRVTHDDDGRPVVDVAEVWALGARSDSEVYTEMRDRISTLSGSPLTLPLAEVIQRLGKVAAELTPHNAEPQKGTGTVLPDWLAQSLVKVVGMPPAEVHQLPEAEAQDIWNHYISTPR